MWRALTGFCPACGIGKLFTTYLKPVEHCAACREEIGHARTDDAAPWLTILIVGDITLPVVLIFDRHSLWPFWAFMIVWPLFALGLAFAVLPRSKGFLLSIITHLKDTIPPSGNCMTR
jgi:uncharacterized protein (DUF983 family)